MTHSKPKDEPLWQKLMINSAVLICLLCLFLGLVQHFVWHLPKPLPHDNSLSADGIVVTTGGQARLKAGLDLLSHNTAPYLLLSGVGQGISKQMIAQSFNLSASQRRALDCCVDLDFAAADTMGNARAASIWAKDKNLTSLLLVTSDYHMPRAALEFSHHMPDRRIILYPIIAPDLADKSWFHEWATMRLYMREYLKYIYRRIALIFA